MNTRIGRTCVLLAALGGCASPSSTTPPSPQAGPGVAPVPAGQADVAPAGDQRTVATADTGTRDAAVAASVSPDDAVVARIGTRAITRAALLKPLMENHGLGTLLSLVQLELAKEAAVEAHVTVTADDIKAEHDLTLGKLFRENDERLDDLIDKAERVKNVPLAERYKKQKAEDRASLLQQFFAKERINPGELDLVLETNAYLRKVAEPRVRGQITDEMLRQEYALQYGEQVIVRHIAFDQPRDYWVARQRVEAGEPFDLVAKAMSKNQQTAVEGGKLPPISRNDERFPANFRDAVFAMTKAGQLSDMIASGDRTWHLVQYVGRVTPRNMPFEKVKPALAEQLLDRAITSVMGKIRDNIAAYARQSLQVTEPTLSQQFKERLDQFNKTASEERARLQAEEMRLGGGIVSQPALSTQPTVTQPATTQPATTQPGATTKPADPGPVLDVAPVFDSTPATNPAAAPAGAPAAGAAAATKPAGPATAGPAGSPK